MATAVLETLVYTKPYFGLIQKVNFMSKGTSEILFIPVLSKTEKSGIYFICVKQCFDLCLNLSLLLLGEPFHMLDLGFLSFISLQSQSLKT